MLSLRPPNPVLDLVDRVLDERMWDTMYLQHEGPFYDVMRCVHRDLRQTVDSLLREHGTDPKFERVYLFERPKGDSYSTGPMAADYSQFVDLQKGWKHVVPLWRVRRSLLEEVYPIHFTIEHPPGLMPMIPLSKNFHCVEVMPETGVDDMRDYPIAFFSDTDAIAAQALIAVGA